MSGFGNTLFSGSRFIFWSLGPILLLGGLAFLALAAWPPPGAGLRFRIGAALLGLLCLILVLVLYDPARFWIASRAITGTVFLAYLAYFLSDPLKGTRGLLVIGLPCLWWTLLGRFSLRLEVQGGGGQAGGGRDAADHDGLYAVMSTGADRSDKFVWTSPAGVVASQCAYCRNALPGAPYAACTAFPEGIPEEILANDFDHRYEVEGERDGIRFDPRDDVPDAVLERLYEVLDAGA